MNQKKKLDYQENINKKKNLHQENPKRAMKVWNGSKWLKELFTLSP